MPHLHLGKRLASQEYVIVFLTRTQYDSCEALNKLPLQLCMLTGHFGLYQKAGGFVAPC